ncbi:DUF4157 domain-containing protein [Nostoc flagelliforme FACHB-838]|uniref:DUF4157 domain-containing protein n=1 Tax=Nostoc flagelliforme FACHB-838 TaxID=2692904 RepID=A0ABR8E0L0_9NOSO|nr:DUF4157 domain-containing protein [Nostoc flagelliforme]MBD2534948.1 DUF4157 domain-containing protein [Nostoc flagelliforme FACHB-838]
MSDRTFRRHNAGRLNHTNSSLVSSNIPTLANPTRGFTPTNNTPLQTVTETADELIETQSTDEQFLESEAIKEKPLSHDISRMSLRSPQAKFAINEPENLDGQETSGIAHQVMQRMSEPVDTQFTQHEELPEDQDQLSEDQNQLPEDEDQLQMKSLGESFSLQREELPEDQDQLQMKHQVTSFQAFTEVQPSNKGLGHDISRISLRRPQTKLTVNEPGDVYEQEADKVAQQVMQRMSEPAGNQQSIQREELPEEEEELQMKSLTASSQTVSGMQPLTHDISRMSLRLQTRLTVNQPGDIYEQEADRVAGQVMQRMSESVNRQSIQREALPEEKDQLQMKSLADSITPVVQRKGGGGIAATSELETSIQQARGGGQLLSDDIRQPMEQAFGTDFSSVKIHTDSRSDHLNQSVQARAFTTGQDIFFRQGEYSPGSDGGKELLAHELTHVVQQNGGAVQPKSIPDQGVKNNKIQTKAFLTSPSIEQPIQRRENPQQQPERDNQGQVEQATVKADVQNREGQRQAPVNKGVAAASPPADGGGAAAGTSGNPSANQNKNNPQQQGEADKQGQLKQADPKANPQQGQQPPDGKGSVAAGLPGAEAGGEKAPASANDDPGFQAVVGTTKEVAAKQKKHEPAKNKAQEAQSAAVPPGNEVDSKAQANQVGEMEQTETPQFDAADFKAKLMERIADVAPKNLEEADNFKNNNKLDSVKGDLSGKVDEEQKASQKPLEEKAKETPDTSGIESKKVTPLSANDPGAPASDIGAEKAAPKPKGQSEVEAPLQQDSKKLDQQMSEANVTEEQLANSNEPEFQGALKAKEEAQTNAVQAPPKYRQQEQDLVKNAQAAALGTAQQNLQDMHGVRTQQLGQVGEQQVGAKSKDEQARVKVATDINKIYEDTKVQVEKTLGDLDSKVQQEFDAGAAEAKKVFEDYVDQRMKKYKDDRYSGFWGPGKWLIDKLFGMPSEVNAFYEEGRQMYIGKMDAVIDKVITIISKGLTQAKAEIAKGKQKIEKYVNQLPEDLKGVGQQAATEIQGKFEELQQSVSDKENELIDTLAQKYQENLKAVDDRINQMKEENKGLVQKAIDFVVGVVKTIIELGKLLLQVLAKAASIIPKILQDPIGFLKNVVQGIKQGFQNFVKNIGKHLQQGLIGWLTGTLAEAGVTMPESFDMKGIFGLVMEVLGLGYEGIRKQAVKKFGRRKAELLEERSEIYQIIAAEGVAGLWQFVQDQIGDLRALVLDPLKDFVIQNVIEAGVTWILSLFNPASAFIKACQAIYEIVMFFIERASQIAELINAIIDAIVAIASGSIEAAAKGIEDALAKALPVVISFLASLLGLGGISQKVQAIIAKVRRPFEKALLWVIEKEVKLVAGIEKKFDRSKGNKEKNKHKDKDNKSEEKTREQKAKDNKSDQKTREQKAKDNKSDQKTRGQKAKDKYNKTLEKGKEKVAAIVEWWKAKKKFKASDGETHTLFFKGADRNSTLMVASKNPKPYTQFLEWVEGNETLNDDKTKAIKEAKLIAQDIEQETTRPLGKKLSSAQKEKAMKEKKENIEKLLQKLQTPTAKLFGSDLPDWQPPKLGGVNSAGFGKWMKAEALTKVKVGSGSAPTQAKHDIYDILNKRRDKGGSASYYVRGHLLNEKLGGEGKWENMTPLSRAGNGEHEAQFESLVKAAVNSGAIMEYHVEPIYQQRSDKTSLKAEVDKLYPSSPKDTVEIKEIIDAEDHVPVALTCHTQRLEKVNNKLQGVGTPRAWSLINEVKRNADDYFIQNSPSKKSEPIDINSASLNELENIPGITKSQAEDIHKVVQNRKRPFGQYDTLARETGIGLPELKKLKENGNIVLR